MPIIQENPTYFTDKPPISSSLRHHHQSSCKTSGARRKHSTTFFEDTEDGDILTSYDTNCYSECKSSHLNNNTKTKTESNGIRSKPLQPTSPPPLKSGMSLSRLGQLFKKSKSKHSVGSESHGSTVESSGLGSPTCTPDSSLSIYTNSLDGDSQSSNSNQISPKLDSMEDRLVSMYKFDDCDIFAANMYYNVGESSVFTIYHPHQPRSQTLGPSTSRNVGSRLATTKGPYASIRRTSDRDDEFEDCVQPYYNNKTFSTFPNPKRSSISSSSQVNENITPHLPEHDGDGYLRPNEPRNLRNVKNLYINDSVENGQVQHVQVDVHTPTSFSLKSNSNSGFNSSAASANSNGSRYQFDSAGSTTSAATTLVAGGSHNFRLPQNPINKDENPGSSSELPVYMNRAYFSSNSISGRSSSKTTAALTDCEPYCSLCASSIMGSPRQRSKMDVAIVKCRECFFSREAETHIRGFFDKLMTEDKQKMDVALKSYDLKDLDHPSDSVVVHSAKVQIVIISHHFLQRLKDEASRRPRLSPINRVFRSKSVIAVLIAVSEKEVLDGFESVLPRFREWFSVDLRSTNKYDPEFCKKFTEQVVRIYNVELSNSSSFSVFPKKVTREQPKIAIIFKKPVDPQDEIRIELRTARQVHSVTDFKMETPHTTLIRIPESLSPDREAIVDVCVIVNKNKIGGSRIKTELNLRRYEDDEIDRMAKLLPPFLDWLDVHISESLMKHFRECTDYTVDPDLELMNGIIICRGDILPTIMHFAAYYGLQKTAVVALDEADSLAHCSVRNELGELPADIAASRDHPQISQLISEYQEISNSYRAYKYVKELLEKDTGQLEESEDGTENSNLEDNGANLTEDEGAQPCSESNDEAESAKETNTIPEAVGNGETNESPSEPGSSTRSEDDEVEVKIKPTPLTRKRINRIQKGKQYVNLNGNPAENPEYVETRPVRKITPALTDRKWRQTLMPGLTYDIPRPQALDYKLPPPEVRPVNPSTSRSEAKGPVLVAKGKITVTESGYLLVGMDDEEVPALPKTDDELSEVETEASKEEGAAALEPPKPPEPEPQEAVVPVLRKPSLQHDNANGIIIRDREKKNAVVLDPADEQLINLLNDFKNNTYDMTMVELLFENWKQRPDVQRSVEEKMKMLEKLREEYRHLREHQSPRGPAKKSAIDRIKTIFSIKRRKGSTATPAVSEGLYDLQRKPSYSSESSSISGPSPTDVTFSGPSLPSQPFSNSIPDATSPGTLNPPPFFNSHNDRIDSVSSIRTSFGSDSSSDGEKSGNADERPSDPSQGYHVPPPPRPVKPSRKPVPAIPEEPTSPTVPRRPPAFPDEAITSPKLLKKPPMSPPPGFSPTLPSKPVAVTESKPVIPPETPPQVPAKPLPKYVGTEPVSPPPQPPPRSQNASNLFSYIDYKQKNAESKQVSQGGIHQSYENTK